MKKPTTSDAIKALFAEYGGGDEKDWKRLSKKKNEAGELTRAFENRKTGVRIEVVEHADGSFDVHALEADAPMALTLETDAARNKAADEIIDQLVNGDIEDEIPAALLQKAGTALANRFVFGIGVDEVMSEEEDRVYYYGFFSPITEEPYDQHLSTVIEHLLPPGCDESMECTFTFEGEYADPAALVKELTRRGFIFDADLQKNLDDNADTGNQMMPKLGPILAEAAANKALLDIVKGEDPPQALLREAGPALAKRFSFTVIQAEGMDGLFAIVMPQGMTEPEDSKKSYAVMKHLCPDAEYVDDCVIGYWEFPAEIDTPLKLAEELMARGFVFDKKNQDPSLMDALKPIIQADKKPAGKPPTL